ncbi:hypothetical protein KF728_16905 [Candidatus Obscuribacterales bacterium]|jgi:hypothetical protein|nr:hypothetical protein [Candidatus Obscuribacterales bacterium]
MSPGGIVLRILILVVAFCVLIAVLAFALKVVFMLAAIIGIVLCVGASFLVFRHLFFPGSKEKKESGLRETRLWSQAGEVQLFKEEPKVHQLVDKSSANLPARLVTVPSDQEVTVLQESDIAIRIKIKSGEYKGRIGWVDKANVTGYSEK